LKILVTGANGDIGGSVAAALIADGHEVRGLVRSKEKADADLLQAEARAADAVVNAASSDHRGAVEALISGLSGSGKPFLHRAAAASWRISPWVNRPIESLMR
jgi:uncharacterized protein YbjT (DUF2867 family)